MSEQRYVAAPGLQLPISWPDDGRPIDPMNLLHIRMVRDGDLVPVAKAVKSEKETDK